MSAFDSFPGRKALVERTPLIKHTGPKQTQEELQRIQNAERSSSNSENQQFLKDVVNQVLLGEGVGWLKLNRMKKLMEDESYRMLVLGKMNRTLDKRIAPDDHIDDVVGQRILLRVSLKLFLTFESLLLVHSQARVQGHDQVCAGGGAWTGPHVFKLWSGRNGLRIPIDGDRSHPLLDQGAQRGGWPGRPVGQHHVQSIGKSDGQ